jgi:Protein of unknown function (DUF1579)
MCLRTTLTVGVLAVISSMRFSLAQTASTSPKPGPEVKKLSMMVGTWSAEGTLKSNDTGRGGRLRATETCAWTANGFGIACHSIDDLAGRVKVTGASLVGYDPASKTYTYVEVGALGTSVYRGTVEGESWTWISNDKTTTQRFTMTYTSKDSCDWKLEEGPNADSMKTVMEAKETRVASTAAAKPVSK